MAATEIAVPDLARARERLREVLIARSLRFGDFTLASGAKSHYYVDVRQTSLDGEGALLIATLMLPFLREAGVEAVGGLTLGADPIVGAMLSLAGLEDLPLRGFIVRKQAKDHGTRSLVEGALRPGERVVIVEDVVTTGGSSLQAIAAVKEMGCEVRRVLAVVDREEGGRGALAAEGCRLESIFTAAELLAAARQNTP